jgi:hypothetical protein
VKTEESSLDPGDVESQLAPHPNSVPDRLGSIWMPDLVRYERVLSSPSRTPFGLSIARSELRHVLLSEQQSLDALAELVRARREAGEKLVERLTSAIGDAGPDN